MVTFSTLYPETSVSGLYWEKGVPLSGENNDEDYLYISTENNTVIVSNGAALYDLELDRLPMLAIRLYSKSEQVITLKSITIDNTVVARPDATLTVSGFLSITEFVENYMSYARTGKLNISVLVTVGDIHKTISGFAVLPDQAWVVLRIE